MAKAKKDAHVTLFFIDGPAASDEQRAEAAAIEGIVRYRNTLRIRCDDGSSLEPFDGVAGAVPSCYAEAARIKAGEPPTEAPAPASALPGPASPLKPGAAPKPPEAPKPGASVWKPNA